MGWLCGVVVFELIECPHSLPDLHSGLQIIIIIISYVLFYVARHVVRLFSIMLCVDHAFRHLAFHVVRNVARLIVDRVRNVAAS